MTLGELLAICHEYVAQGKSPETEIEIYLDNLRIMEGDIFTEEVEESTIIRPFQHEDIRVGYDGAIAIHVVTAEIISAHGENQKDVRVRC